MIYFALYKLVSECKYKPCCSAEIPEKSQGRSHKSVYQMHEQVLASSSLKRVSLTCTKITLHQSFKVKKPLYFDKKGYLQWPGHSEGP